jgi:antiviral helicase SKI2
MVTALQQTLQSDPIMVLVKHCLYYGGELYKICEQSTFLPEGVTEAHKAYHAKTAKLSTSSAHQSFLGASSS